MTHPIPVHRAGPAEAAKQCPGDRTTLNELYAQLHRNLLPLYPHLQGVQPVYREFRAGDVRHSLADISKAQRLLGYAPTQRIGQGLELAMPWYIGQAGQASLQETQPVGI